MYMVWKFAIRARNAYMQVLFYQQDMNIEYVWCPQTYIVNVTIIIIGILDFQRLITIIIRNLLSSNIQPC